MRPDELERRLHAWTPSAPLPEQSFFTSSCSGTSSGPTGSASCGAIRRAGPFAELLIDCEEDRTLRAALVGMLREMER